MAATPTIETIPGFQICAVKAGIKTSGKLDMGLIVADKPATAAGVFTTSKVVAAPVTLDRAHLATSHGRARAILVNAGNANACTGTRGMEDAHRCAEMTACLLGAQTHDILLCSTGIIGHHLPMDKMAFGIGKAGGLLGCGRSGQFAKAIMTTDLKQKTAGVTVRALGNVSIAGVAKGSGMIAPNMATMLGFVLTNAAIAPKVLQTALRDVANCTFNCVTVDGDTSTNDTLLCLASGVNTKKKITRAGGTLYHAFCKGLEHVCRSLSEQIAADGEGATKMVRVRVAGAKSLADARACARTIAESPLVKTAFFGNDPNWGRILAAAGRSGCALREESTTIKLCGVTLYRRGTPARFDAGALSKKMKAKAINLDVGLGLGKGACEMLTCDFSYDYVKINAEYHT